jgi:hypothetical protein
MYKIEQDQKTEERFWYQQNYQEAQDAIGNAYQLSGLMGTVYGVDADGNMVDTGVPTFDYIKWEDTRTLQWLQYDRNISNDSWDKAQDLLEMGEWESAEAVLGVQAGTFQEYGTTKEKLLKLESMKAEQEVYGEALLGLAASNGAIGSIYRQNSYGGQCGEFIHNFLTDYKYGLNTLQQKKTMINSYLPQAGAAVITNEQFPGTNTGHVAMVNKVENGYIYLTESNYGGNEMVTNDRRLPIDSPKIEGYFNGTLVPEIAKFQKSVGSVKIQKYLDQARTLGIDQAENNLKDEISDGKEQAQLMELFNDAVYEQTKYTFKGDETSIPWMNELTRGMTVNTSIYQDEDDGWF